MGVAAWGKCGKWNTGHPDGRCQRGNKGAKINKVKDGRVRETKQPNGVCVCVQDKHRRKTTEAVTHGESNRIIAPFNRKTVGWRK